MKRFLKVYMIEQKLALRSGDMLIFGVAMPVGIMILINMIAGQKQAGEGFTYLESSFASLIAVGICAAACNIFPTSGYPMKEPRCMMCRETYEGSLDGIHGYIVYDMYFNA